jgi:hypothetical protein
MPFEEERIVSIWLDENFDWVVSIDTLNARGHVVHSNVFREYDYEDLLEATKDAEYIAHTRNLPLYLYDHTSTRRLKK